MARLLRAWVRPLVAVAVLAGGAAGLCGCSDESEPSVSVTPTVTDGGVLSPSPSPSPTVLPELTEQELLELLPESATNESFPGAVDFAIWFTEESQRVFQTRDSRVFDAVSLPGCTFCANVRADLDYVTEHGESVEGGDLAVADVPPSGGLQPDGSWGVTLTLQQEAIQYYGTDGSLVDEIAAEVVTVNILLEFKDGRFWVRDIGRA